MRVNHRGRVARLLRGLVFVGVCGKMVGAKGVAQSVGFARHFRAVAQFHEMLLECDFVTCPKFAGCQLAEWFKPSGQRGADFHKTTLARLGLARRDFNVTGDAPHVRPIQAQQFRRAESGQSANGDDRARG